MKNCLSIRIFLISVCMMLSACAHMGTNPNSEESLRQKVQTEWDAKLKKDWGTVYDMATDAYKKTIDRNSYIRRANVLIEDFSIKEVKILESGKEARAVVDYTVNQMAFKFNFTADETWIWENGDWHLDIPPPGYSPFNQEPPKK